MLCCKLLEALQIAVSAELIHHKWCVLESDDLPVVADLLKNCHRYRIGLCREILAVPHN